MRYASERLDKDWRSEQKGMFNLNLDYSISLLIFGAKIAILQYLDKEY